MTTTDIIVRKIPSERFKDIPKMDPEWKAEWLTALRSEEYQQGDGALLNYKTVDGKDVPKHCCLGVLCDLASKKGLGEWGDKEDNEGLLFQIDKSLNISENDEVEDMYAPLSLADMVGLGQMRDTKYLHLDQFRGVQNMLASFNDDGYTFAEIANFIEENL